MGVTGLELDDVSACKNNMLHDSAKSGDAESDAVSVASILADSNLQVIVTSWAKLPEAIKSGILAIVNESIDKLEPNG